MRQRFGHARLLGRSLHAYNRAEMLLCTGAKGAPVEAIPVLMAVRMGRYLSGPGRMPVQSLVPAYLELLEELSSIVAGRGTPE